MCGPGPLGPWARMVLPLVVLDKTIDIQAPPQAVFSLLTRVAQSPRWLPGTVRATRDGGGAAGPPAAVEALHQGSRVHTVVDAAGMRLQSAQELVAFRENALFGWRQHAGDFARHEGAYSLVPTPGGGTRLRLRMEVELPFVLPVFLTEAEVHHLFSSRMDRALMNLKDLAEGAAS